MLRKFMLAISMAFGLTGLAAVAPASASVLPAAGAVQSAAQGSEGVTLAQYRYGHEYRGRPRYHRPHYVAPRRYHRPYYGRPCRWVNRRVHVPYRGWVRQRVRVCY